MAQDEKTANYRSTQMGITQVHGWTKQINEQPDRDVRSGYNLQIHSRPLLHPHECRAIAENRMAIFVRGMKGVIPAQKTPYFSIGWLRRRAGPNPYYAGNGGWLKNVLGVR